LQFIATRRKEAVFSAPRKSGAELKPTLSNTSHFFSGKKQKARSCIGFFV
jgi:hypothetical protein